MKNQFEEKTMGLDICHAKPSIKSEEIMDWFTIEELMQNPAFVENHKHFITSIDDEEDGQIPVMYFVDKGYQRKRMNSDFIHQSKTANCISTWKF